ncbi:MAG: hypothetical protein KGI71_04790 [Patescibacteria group bacterium]|nr:hypothetical protein [Patescibacteria group bacterium]
MATVTCVYTILATGQATPAQLANAMAAANVPIPPEFFTLTGATLTSDNTAVVGASAVRTIVFGDVAPQFVAQFPVDKTSPFLGLMTLPIQAYVNARVIESLPVAA